MNLQDYTTAKGIEVELEGIKLNMAHANKYKAILEKAAVPWSDTTLEHDLMITINRKQFKMPGIHPTAGDDLLALINNYIAHLETQRDVLQTEFQNL